MKRIIRKIEKRPQTIRETVDSVSKTNGVTKRNVSKVTTKSNVPTVRVGKHVSTKGAKNEPNITYHQLSPMWINETVFIIGGGPSLSNFDFNALLGKKVIAINKAILSYPQAQALYWTDSRFYGWYEQEVDSYKGLKYTIRPNYRYTENSEVNILRKGKKFGLEKAVDTLAHGNNSGYAAINLAYHLGARRIILLGYDMGNNGTKSHFHEGYPTRQTSDKIYQDQFIPGFKQLAEELKAKNIEVLNASPYSRLTSFPKITLEKAMLYK